jgi:UDP:flavonoid glycosyltransferase YjiC (YdhE family)
MRVLLVADGSRGDVQPMRVLASALAVEGHSITFAAPPGMRGMVEAAGLRFVPLAHDAEAMIQELSAQIIRGTRAVTRAVPPFFRTILESQMQVLPELIKECDFVLVGGLHFAVPTLAARYGVPWRWVLYSVTMLPSSARPPLVVPLARAPRWVNWLGWRYLNWFTNSHLRGPINQYHVRLGLPLIAHAPDHLICENPIIAIDPELAPLTPEESELDVIGHLDPGPGDPLPSELEAFLNAGPPPIYIGFGSMPDPAAAATTELFQAACKQLSRRLVLSRGWAGFGAGLSKEHIVVDSVSHVRLFPRVAAVVHHGGSGTTSAAMRAGVPQVVVPHFADQYHFGGLVEDLGVGAPPLARTRLTARRLAERLERLMGDGSVRERAKLIAERIGARPRLSNVSRLLRAPEPREHPRPSTQPVIA